MDEKLLKHGSFCWFELMTTDINGSKDFYKKLFGWDLKDQPMGDFSYTVVNANGDDVAGIMLMPKDSKDMPPTWGIYITVDNIEDTVKKAKKSGGTILVEPKDIPQIGKFAIIQDPQGAWFAPIEYKGK